MEEYLDALKMLEDLNSQKTLCYVKDKNNICNIVLILVYELSCAVSGYNIPYTIAMHIVIGVILDKLRYNWKKLDNILMDQLLSEIRKTGEYQKCIELYSEYIKRLAELISKFEFRNIREIAQYFDLLLQNGGLSTTSKNTYQLYKYDHNYIVELLGARTLSGASICRHMSALAADCFTELGHKAEILSVTATESLSKLNTLRDLRKLEWNHGVVGILDNDHKFLYDPTSSRFSGKTTESSKELEEYISKIPFTTSDTYLVISPKQYSFSKNHNNLKEVATAPLETLSDDEMFALKEHIVEIFCANKSLAVEFYLNNLQLTKEISELESHICPHSDSPILKWQLKR